jgi:membrane-bound ClpP family serine protease
VVSLDHLIGKTGVTVTRLAPAGKVDIENHLHNVSADDMLIESGMAVQVTAVRSGRIIVVPYSQETK